MELLTLPGDIALGAEIKTGPQGVQISLAGLLVVLLVVNQISTSQYS